MKFPLKIAFRALQASPSVEAEIRDRAQQFDQFCQYILYCNVTIEVLGKHRRGGHHYNVRVDIAMPGGELAVSRNHDDADLLLAVHAAFDAAGLWLEDHVQRLRRKVKTHESPLHGRVSKLFAGDIGFIETADGLEFYFSRDSVMEPCFERLALGAEVQFLEALGTECLQARRIVGGHAQFGGS